MASIYCNNKGCGKQTIDSMLDEATNEIICSACNKPILGISEFLKRALKGTGNVIKMKTNLAFLVDCKFCKKHGQPIMIQEKPSCFYCNKELQLSPQFVKMFQEYLKNNSSK